MSFSCPAHVNTYMLAVQSMNKTSFWLTSVFPFRSQQRTGNTPVSWWSVRKQSVKVEPQAVLHPRWLFSLPSGSTILGHRTHHMYCCGLTTLKVKVAIRRSLFRPLMQVVLTPYTLNTPANKKGDFLLHALLLIFCFFSQFLPKCMYSTDRRRPTELIVTTGN